MHLNAGIPLMADLKEVNLGLALSVHKDFKRHGAHSKGSSGVGCHSKN